MRERADTFLAQSSIAIVGVSRDTKKTANFIYRKLRQEGYRVFAVNPNTSMVEGDPCYPNLQAIPEKPGAVMIVTRPALTVPVVRECAELGISHVWMHEGLDMKGSSVSKESVAYCQAHDIQVIPGGCPMMYCKHRDFGHRVIRWIKNLSGSLPADI